MNELDPIKKESAKRTLFPKSLHHKILCFYFVMPFLIGLVLGNWMSDDVSDIIIARIGLLHSLAKAGVDMHTNAVILLLYLMFSPCLFYLIDYKKPLSTIQNVQFKNMSIFKILMNIMFLLFVCLLFSCIIFLEIKASNLITPRRSTRVVIGLAQTNITFAVFAGAIVFIITYLFISVMLYVRELTLRIKNGISHISKHR